MKRCAITLFIIQFWAFLPVCSQEKTITHCQYWFDQEQTDTFTIPCSEVDTFRLSLDTKDLSIGVHRLYFRFKDSEDVWSPLYDHTFFRGEVKKYDSTPAVTRGEYWIDQELDSIQSMTISNDTMAFVFDANRLHEGFHTLNYRVIDNIGNYSALQTWTFYKSSNIKKASRISAYQYWWNNHYDKMETIPVNNDSAIFVFEDQISVPDFAKNDGYTANSFARFQIIFIDDAGNKSRVEWVDITYPDLYPPISTIKITNQTTGSVCLAWSANEDEIEDYNIYFSENDQPFILWLPNTTITNAVFELKPGISYRFTVTARDKSGNQELFDKTKCVVVNNSNE